MAIIETLRGAALAKLKQFDAMVWSDVDVITKQGTYDGLISPRVETADDLHIVIKLPVGYNVGVAAEKIVDIKVKGRKEAHYKIPEKEFPYNVGPRVKLFGTGMHASRLDYRTGVYTGILSPGRIIWFSTRAC